ncbi:MAG: FkbM family methyltransferase [Verrucomicrobia bacterium]|nr:FkbM family methyltransferase [Verrucomicrobiota bacterium]
MGHFAKGESGKQNLRVSVTTLDHAMERFGRPNFIKLDIEGAEGGGALGQWQGGRWNVVKARRTDRTLSP